MKKRASDRQPWMSPEDYGRSIRPGIGFNLLVKDIARSVKFAEDVLGATATYADEDFAVLRLNGSEWMLHADHTYSDNPLSGVIGNIESRGAGVELRVYGCDPDQAEAHARAHGFTVLGRYDRQAAWLARMHAHRRGRLCVGAGRGEHRRVDMAFLQDLLP